MFELLQGPSHEMLVANGVGLVYIAAFGLDAGESINGVGGDAPPARMATTADFVMATDIEFDPSC